MLVGSTINFMVLIDLLQCGVTPFILDAGGLRERKAVDDIGTVRFCAISILY
jgi:hypothetical protein